MSEHEEELKNAFRQHIAAELSSPEVAKAREKLIRDHFRPAPPLVFRPVFLIPALSFVFALLILFQVHKPISKPMAVSLKEAVELPQMREAPYMPPELGVDVEVVSSEVGPTLVYQKMVQNKPITVIWVFTGGAAQ